MARLERRLPLLVACALALLALLGALVSSGSQGAAGAAPPQDLGPGIDNPGRGMVWAGLEAGTGACDGAYQARDRRGVVVACTHGPDPAPPGTDVRTDGTTAELTADAAAETTATAVPCLGDGSTGYRVEAIYAVPSDRTDRFSTVGPLITNTYAPRVESQFARSAAETGGEAHVRWVTTPDGTGCTLVVRHEVLSTTSDDTFANTISELKARGYNRVDRKYLVWMDSNVYCGIGQVYGDTRPDQANANNGSYTMFARSDSGCWAYAEAHELMHNLGGVQPSAPNGTSNYHCDDEPDEMCYDDDGSGPVVMRNVCTGRDGTLFDCNHDDYFYAGTAPTSSWLATHWNTWTSRFLHRAALTDPAPPPPPTTVTDSFSGSFTKNRRTITHTFSSGAGALSVTVNAPSGRKAVPVTATLYAPDGSSLGSSTGTGTRSFNATGTAAGSYRLVVTGTSGSYTASVTHPS